MPNFKKSEILSCSAAGRTSHIKVSCTSYQVPLKQISLQGNDLSLSFQMLLFAADHGYNSSRSICFYSVCLHLSGFWLIPFNTNYNLPAAIYIWNFLTRSILPIIWRAVRNTFLSSSSFKKFPSSKTIGKSFAICNSNNWSPAKEKNRTIINWSINVQKRSLIS